MLKVSRFLKLTESFDSFCVCAINENRVIQINSVNPFMVYLFDFYSIAKKIPDYEFLAIKGSYDNQILTTLPNVKTVPPTPYIREYYKDVAVICMLSHYESRVPR